jgi:hypothetical protein
VVAVPNAGAISSRRSDLDDVTIRVGKVDIVDSGSVLTLADKTPAGFEGEGDRLVQSAAVFDGDAEVVITTSLADSGPLLIVLRDMERQVVKAVWRTQKNDRSLSMDDAHAEDVFVEGYGTFVVAHQQVQVSDPIGL